MPATYRQAGAEWRAFLAEAREEMGLVSDNSTYTAVQGVFRAFRARLTVQEAIDFAQVLPAVPRALFVADWRLDDPVLPPGGRDDWTRDARGLRPDHNLTPEGCVEAVAVALRRSVRAVDLDRALARLPPFATAFWSTPSADPASLGPRIV